MLKNINKNNVDQSSTNETQKNSDTVYALAASPTYEKDGICFAAHASGLYRSNDGGHNWDYAYNSFEHHYPLTTSAVVVSPSIAQDYLVFAGVKGGILRSSDGGNTWFSSELPAPPPLFSKFTMSPNFEDDGIILAATIEDGVFYSEDRGLSWQPSNFGLLDRCVLSIAMSTNFARDETVYAGTETGIYRSTNGGRAWHYTDFPNSFAPVIDP